MKKEDKNKLNKLASRIDEINHYLAKELKSEFFVKEAKKFGDSSHIILPKVNEENKFAVIKISEEQYEELKKKK